VWCGEWGCVNEVAAVVVTYSFTCRVPFLEGGMRKDERPWGKHCIVVDSLELAGGEESVYSDQGGKFVSATAVGTRQSVNQGHFEGYQEPNASSPSRSTHDERSLRPPATSSGAVVGRQDAESPSKKPTDQSASVGNVDDSSRSDSRMRQPPPGG
jgi:hypothetical protein